MKPTICGWDTSHDSCPHRYTTTEQIQKVLETFDQFIKMFKITLYHIWSYHTDLASCLSMAFVRDRRLL
jgi:hypothetical protein